MAKKIDPLNKKQYGGISAMLTVVDIKSAVTFYQKALGFTKRGMMNGPDGKPMHAELRFRDTTVMLGPESPSWGARGPKSLGGSPVTLFLYVDNVDKALAKAAKLGATITMPAMDMFWGDRCGNFLDPEGHPWMLGTHISEPTPKEMKKKLAEQMKASAGSAGAA